MFNLGIVRNRNAKTALGSAAASEPADAPADSDKALDDADLEHVAGGRSLDWFDDFQTARYRSDADPS